MPREADKDHLRAQDGRIEKILIQIAAQYAPQILRQWDQRLPIETRCAWLARRLADFNILVIVGGHNYSLQSIAETVENNIHQWVNGFGRLYYLLAQTLFPNYGFLDAHYTDEGWPLVIYLQGAATPIIQQMAGLVYPYVVKARLEPEISHMELVGVMEEVLDQLVVSGLPRGTQVALRNEGAAAIKFMLKQPIEQLWLTEFDNNTFEDSQRYRPQPSIPMPPQPTTLPGPVQKYLDGSGPQHPLGGATQSLGPTQPMGSRGAPMPPEPPTVPGDSGRIYYNPPRQAPVPPLPPKKKP